DRQVQLGGFTRTDVDEITAVEDRAVDLAAGRVVELFHGAFDVCDRRILAGTGHVELLAVRGGETGEAIDRAPTEHHFRDAGRGDLLTNRRRDGDHRAQTRRQVELRDAVTVLQHDAAGHAAGVEVVT